MVLFSGPTFQKKKKQQNCSSTGNSEWRSVNPNFPWSYCSAAKTRTKHFLPPREVIDKGRAKKTDRHRGKEDRQTVQRQYGSNGLRIKQWSTYKTNYDPLIFVLSKLYLHLYHVRVQKFPGDWEGFQRIIILQGEGIQEFKKLELNILEGGLVMEIPS